MSGRLQGRTALVTGGGSGIGYAVCEMFAFEGANVILVGRSKARLDAAVDEIRERVGPAAHVVSVAGAVHIKEEVERIVAFADSIGVVDVLVNNAGVCHEAALVDTPEEIWVETLDVNLKGPYLLSAAIARRMIERNVRGSIINTASIDATRPEPLYAAYNCSKAGVVALTQTLALELGGHGIRVNAVSPGPTRTPLFENVLPPEALERYAARAEEAIPLRRIAEPKDIARAFLFLASEDAAYLTGETMVVDGGRSLVS